MVARKTLYIAQPFFRRGRALTTGRAYSFPCAVDAEEAGRELSRVSDGVLVYAVTGDPEFEVWGEPELFATHGDVPRIEY